ncbi:MAG TPA: carboxypeptidase regulatory-like domain-containing protein [Thermoanaerobaculia bacterium]|nr:carboxypeptidase regulatory-like domain-containing protein [Thermoanaerobaculia bacterium]
MRRGLILFLILLISVPLLAQQTGAIHGTVLAIDGSALPGVTVEASSNVLPQPRVTVTDGAGNYRLPALQPGAYTVQYTLGGMQTVTRKAEVLLGQDAAADVKMGAAAVSESITVTAGTTLVDKESTAISSGLSNEQIQALPVAQEYRDLQKLIPGVQYTQDTIRGPSAGASGQDNVYLFDGANVTMPLFGVLVAEPSTHDIAQVNVVRGGAKAIDFDRAGGFLIDSASKSGANKFFGLLSYQVLKHDFIADQKGVVNSRFQQDRDWATVSLGGPILPDRLFFYGSYYRPNFTKQNQSNLYGSLPQFESKRNEEFGKLTFTPTSSWLVNGSYRHSHREDTAASFGPSAAPTTGQGSETTLQIASLEASKVISPKSFATFKYTDFKNPGGGRPSGTADVTVSTALGTHLDINNLDRLGLLTVPTLLGNNPTQDAFRQAIIDKYGYLSNGVRTGGGTVGFYPDLRDDDSFFRKSGQLGYNYILGSTVTHDLHAGYQRYEDSEDLFRTSNGFGRISAVTTCPASACGTSKPAFLQANFQQQSVGAPKIHSEFHSQNIELNDTIHMNNWSFNVGVMASNDTLYGQGLKKADNLAGFVKSPGTKYKMHEVKFGDEIQPRLGATWAYNGADTVFASYARYNQAANSDARAASWDRNLSRTISAFFDANGNLIGAQPVRSSSGKLFVSGIKPPRIDEYMIGTARQFTGKLSSRLYGRYRHGTHYWEDTNNDARLLFNPPSGIPRELYIPDLAARVTAIGSGSSYVIAELDGAFTKYYEATAETEYHGAKNFVRGSYTWSHYYGNFDQDNSTNNNDQSIFIGSSNIADDAGRQLWNNRYGDLRGDRRHQLKVYGTQSLPWKATAGAFFVYQSGQPYELWSYLPYKTLTDSTSDTNRYAEPAGSRKTPAHHQLDLNYTQNFPLPKGLNLQLLADIFNVYDKQTGYNFENRVGTLGACTTNKCVDTGLVDKPSVNAPYARSFFDPRRYQIAARLQF